MAHLMRQGEEPASREIAAVQRRYWVGPPRYREPAHFVYTHSAGVEDKNAEPLCSSHPIVQDLPRISRFHFAAISNAERFAYPSTRFFHRRGRRNGWRLGNLLNR